MNKCITSYGHHEHDCIEARVEKLEKFKNTIIDDSVAAIHLRINELEDQLQIISKNDGRKYPHVCPICSGKGYMKNIIFGSNKLESSKCIGCESKAIVWG